MAVIYRADSAGRHAWVDRRRVVSRGAVGRESLIYSRNINDGSAEVI